MVANTQSRKWMLTVNHPQDCGLDRDTMLDIISRFSLTYFCLADEIASTGTPHTHIFLYSHSPIRFSTVQKRFPTAHIEKAQGSAQANRDYISKTGRWAGTTKSETSVEGSFYEWGSLPDEAEETSPKMYRLLQDVKEGKSTTEIIDTSPGFAFKAKDIDALREVYLAERCRKENRDVEVQYLFGDSGSGKTSGIYARHRAEDICRITDYGGRNGVRFDAYHGQDVLVFEEFHSQIPIEAMLNYLDVYPLTLPARYSDRVACYTKIYITSNLPLAAQYPDVQRYRLETWRAFLRRIHRVWEYKRGGLISEVLHDQG